MNVPGSPKLHIWLGLLVSLVGVFVGGYAYTGERVYDIWFIPVAVLGFALVAGGSVLAAYGQARRPRLGGASNDEKDDASASWTGRIRAWFGSNGTEDGRGEPAGDAGGEMDVTVECPSCQAVFSRTGDPPFKVSCPECGHEDTVEVPVRA